MFAKSATLFIRVSRKWSIPVGELIASTSASVAAQFPSKFLTKAALIAAFVYSGASVADSCPPPQTLSPPLKLQRVIDGDTVTLSVGPDGLVIGDRVSRSTRPAPENAVVH